MWQKEFKIFLKFGEFPPPPKVKEYAIEIYLYIFPSKKGF